MSPARLAVSHPRCFTLSGFQQKFLPGHSLPPLSPDASGAAVLAGLGFLFLSLPSPSASPRAVEPALPGVRRPCPPGIPTGNAHRECPAFPTGAASQPTRRGAQRRGFPASGTLQGMGWGAAHGQAAVGSSGERAQPRGDVKIPASITCTAPADTQHSRGCIHPMVTPTSPHTSQGLHPPHGDTPLL